MVSQQLNPKSIPELFHLITCISNYANSCKDAKNIDILEGILVTPVDISLRKYISLKGNTSITTDPSIFIFSKLYFKGMWLFDSSSKRSLIFDQLGDEHLVMKINGQFGEYGTITLKNQRTNAEKLVSVASLIKDFYVEQPSKEDLVLKELQIFMDTHKFSTNVSKTLVNMKGKIENILKESVDNRV